MKRPWLAAVACVTWVVAAYSNVFDVGFLWDDVPLIVDDPQVHHLRAPWAYVFQGLWQHRFFSAGAAQPYYRPLVSASYAVEWAVGSGTPLLFHVSNLAVHLLVCAGLWLLGRRAGASPTQSALAVAAFGVVPRLTESVTWVSGRTDLWATAGVVAALCCWTSQRSTGPRALGTSLALFVGLLSKESALVGVGIVAVDVIRRRPLERRMAVGLALVLVGYGALRTSAIGHTSVALRDVTVALASVGHLVHMAATPWHPTPQVGFFDAPEGWAIALGGLAVVGASTVLWRGRRHPAFSLGLGIAAAVLLVAVVRANTFTLTADRYLYLPLALATVVSAHWQWPRWALGLAAALTVALAGQTWRHNALWADDLRFWLAVADDAHPRNPGPPLEVGNALAARARYADAVPHYQRAASSWGDVAENPARLALAVAASHLGDDARALSELAALRAGAPKWRRAWYDWPLFEARAGKVREARAALEAVRRRFDTDDALDGIGRSLDEATPVLERAEASAIERARALATLDATAHAEKEFVVLLDSAEHRDEAATWLVLHGTRANAERAAKSLADETAVEVLALRWSELGDR